MTSVATAKLSDAIIIKSGRGSVETCINPAGFIEQHFIGLQNPGLVSSAVDELVKRAKKLKAGNEPALILVDATGVPKIDVSGKMVRARKKAVKAMETADYDRIAIYASVPVQIMVNTLILVAGKRRKIRVFADRTDAVRWLKSKR